MPETEIFLQSKLLSDVPGLVHGFFTRNGGVSVPPYESLNVSWSNGDSPLSVAENLRRVREVLGVEWLVSGRQVHGDRINIVDDELRSGLEQRPPLLLAQSGDGLATKLRRIGLLIKVADCQSILIVDPELGVAANIHSGWRGSVRNIAGKAISELRSKFGCEPARMLAAIGPSLGPCCAQFRNFRNEIPPDLREFQVRPEYFDFWAITRRQLILAGLSEANIDVIGKCTACGTDDFFSYRGERETGRMAAVVGWA